MEAEGRFRAVNAERQGVQKIAIVCDYGCHSRVTGASPPEQLGSTLGDEGSAVPWIAAVQWTAMTSPFFQARATGILHGADGKVSVTCVVTCSREGDLGLRFDDLPLNRETKWLLQIPDATSLSLEGTDELGRVVTSNSVYVHGRGTKFASGSHWLTLSAIAVWLEINEPDFDSAASVAGVSAVYHAIGLRGIGVQKVQTRAGSLALRANEDVSNFDEITGRFEITATESQVSIAAWRDAADGVAHDLLDIISLADGRRIRWSVRQVIRDGYIVAQEFRGPSRTGAPRRGFHHWHHLQPVLELSLNYTPELKHRTGMNVAIEWSLMNPSYLELDFVACMTALEHLKDVFESRNDQVPAPGRQYFKRKITPALVAVLGDLRKAAAAQEEIAAVDKAEGKLNELNRSTLQDSIEQMLAAYDVPLLALENVLPTLIRLRNDIVHRGIARREYQPHLQRHVDIVRELLTRVFLKLLDYHGTYDSYLDGTERTVSFPNA
jgi:hypothetical protein